MSGLFRIISKEEAEQLSAQSLEKVAESVKVAATPSLRAAMAAAAPGVDFTPAHADAAKAVLLASPDVKQETATTADGTVARLAKLIPIEAATAYAAGLATATALQKTLNQDWPAWWALACLLIAVVLRVVGTQKDSPPPTAIRELLRGAQWQTVIVTAIAFVIWVYAQGGNWPVLHIDPSISGPFGMLAAIIYGFVAPSFVRGSVP